ncbi:uncharacterized protein LOC142574117 [Dermacentor variabilis]|uniref:uncharacterized protein LOC142574117 n=1 Tax=Dermacentor variabilis TaxID=34621 RepID=UPI003F5BC3AE
MKGSAWPATCFIWLVLAVLANTTGMQNEDRDDDATEDYTYATIIYDEFTPIPGVQPPGLNLSIEDYTEGQYPELCLVQGLETGRGLLPIGCNQTCMEQGNISLPNNKLCIQMGSQDVSEIEDFRNFSCLLGLCSEGVCESCDICTWCVKRPIMTIPA